MVPSSNEVGEARDPETTKFIRIQSVHENEVLVLPVGLVIKSIVAWRVFTGAFIRGICRCSDSVRRSIHQGRLSFPESPASFHASY